MNEIKKRIGKQSTMGKLSMCRICLVEDVRMCVVTDKSLQETYEKLTDVPFVTEDRKPMLACLFCCTRLKQCCQLQRKCVEAEELLAQMLSEEYEQKPLKTNHGHFKSVGGFITTRVRHISAGDDYQIPSDAIKQELPAVSEEQDDVELQLTRLSEELEPEHLYNIPIMNHPDVEAHRSESEYEEEQLVMEIKVEEEELSEKLKDRETQRAPVTKKSTLKRKLEDIVPAKQTMYVLSGSKNICKPKPRAPVAKKSTLKRKLEDIVPAKQTMNVLSDSKNIRKPTLSTSDTVAKTKTSIICASQSGFSQSSNLIQHTRIHNDANPSCDICQRSFSSKTNLSKHILIHTGEKPYKCDTCQKSFRQKGDLDTHFRIHSGEKPFKCDVCQKRFSCSSTLRKHIRTHTGEKPHKCDVCQRSFNTKWRWKIHNRIHTGEKPNKCDVCQRSFVEKDSLTKHSKVHLKKNTSQM
ncbi:hypothetical protein PYW07_012629 [Mythimna separata]|uniref:Uncharacterized protein n=1 Tax=Mythimna separata TaxID=271217 RepID=A0AAD8DLF2_MYTSE|nr:hypothetical protein PYW07_012629 [Mythimna separata]